MILVDSALNVKSRTASPELALTRSRRLRPPLIHGRRCPLASPSVNTRVLVRLTALGVVAASVATGRLSRRLGLAWRSGCVTRLRPAPLSAQTNHWRNGQRGSHRLGRGARSGPILAPDVFNAVQADDRYTHGLPGHFGPATPTRLPAGSVKWPTTTPPASLRAGPRARFPPRRSAWCRAASTSGTPT